MVRRILDSDKAYTVLLGLGNGKLHRERTNVQAQTEITIE